MGVRQGWQKLIGKAPSNPGSAIGGYSYQTAPSRGVREILEIYSRNPQIRAPVQRIAEDMVSVPWKAYRRPKNLEPVRMALREAKPWERKRVLKGLQERDDLTEVPNHEALGVLDAGNPTLTGRQVRVLCRIYLELVGEAFLLVEKNRLGRAAELWPIPPNQVSDVPKPGQDFYRVSNSRWGTKTFKADEILWSKYPDPANPYGRGSGMGLALAQEIDIAEYSAAMIISRVFNMAMPAAIIVAKGLNKEDALKLKEQWLQDHRGPLKRGAPMFTDAEDLKVHQFDGNVDDRAIMDVHQATRGEIRKAEGVPPEIMGESENSNRANIVGSKDIYTSFTLCPRLDFDEDQFNERVLPALGFNDVILLYESPVPEDSDFVLEVMRAAPHAFPVDEWRELAKKGELGEGNGGDLHAVAFTTDLRRLDEEPEEQPAVGVDSTSEPPEDDEEDVSEMETAEDEDDLDEQERGFLALNKRVETSIDRIAAAATDDTLRESTEQAFKRGVADWVEFASAQTGVEFSADRIEALTRQHMAGFGSVRIPGINRTTQKKIRKALVRGLRAGMGPDELKGELTRVFGYMKDSRAALIAQTEVTRSSAWASNKVMEAAGITHREWAATRINTRDTHLAMDGQIQPAGSRFYSPSGVTAQYPGDFGVPAEDCNCRCVVVPSNGVKSRSAEQLGALWKTHDRRRERWIEMSEDAFGRGFARQERAVLASLRLLNLEVM